MQDYVVYREGDYTIAQGQIDGHTLTKNKDTAVVLQKTFDALEANGGGELVIGSGVYEVQKPILIPSLVKVTGTGRATVLKLGQRNTKGVIFLADTKEGIVLSDFTCQGIASHETSAGIILHHSGDCEVRNVYARDFSGYGIWVRHQSFMNKLTNNTTSGNDLAGTYFDSCAGGGRGGDYVPNLIIGCTSIGEDGHAFELNNALCVNIVGCQAYQPKGHGFYIQNTSNSTLLSGSRCYQGHKNGIMVENSHELNVSSNVICWNRSHGLELNHVVWGTVSANEFIDNGGCIKPLAYGIYMHTDTKSVQVTGNTIFNWEGHVPMLYGIYEANDCQDNRITNNIINYYTDKAVFSAGTNTKVANNLAVENYYIHPGLKPFPKPRESKLITSPFKTDRVDNFLEQTRR